MSEFPFSDRELERAAARSMQARLAALPEPEDCPEHRFSAEFQEKMKLLLEKEMPRPRPAVSFRRAAALAAVFAFCFISAVFYGTEAGASWQQWITEQIGGSYIYRLADDSAAPESLSFTLGWVPEGLELVEADEIEGVGSNIYYADETQMTICVLEAFYTTDTEMQIITDEGQVIEKVIINGYEAEYYPENGDDTTRALIWYDEEYETMLCIMSNLNKNEIIRIANSVIIDENIKK